MKKMILSFFVCMLLAYAGAAFAADLPKCPGEWVGNDYHFYASSFDNGEWVTAQKVGHETFPYDPALGIYIACDKTNWFVWGEKSLPADIEKYRISKVGDRYVAKNVKGIDWHPVQFKAPNIKEVRWFELVYYPDCSDIGMRGAGKPCMRSK